jgi:hypothetical protein
MKTRFVVIPMMLAAAVCFAGFRRQSAAFCVTESDLAWFQMTPGNGLVWKGIGNGKFYCPLLDDSKFNRNTLSTVNVHVNDTNPSLAVTATLCAQVWWSTGSICGNTSASTTTQGPATLVLGAAPWTADVGNFAYVDLSVCSNCEVYGFFSGT